MRFLIFSDLIAAYSPTFDVRSGAWVWISRTLAEPEDLCLARQAWQTARYRLTALGLIYPENADGELWVGLNIDALTKLCGLKTPPTAATTLK